METKLLKDIQKIIDEKGDLNKRINLIEENFLMLSCRSNYLKCVELLLDNNVDLNLKDDNGFCALIKAINYENYEICKKLVNKGADVNLSDDSSSTPLMYAITGVKDKEIIQLLLDKGALVDVKDSEYEYTALMHAVDSRNSDFVTMLLEKKADPNLQDKYGWTALMQAIDNGTFEIVQILCNKRKNEEGKYVKINDSFDGADLYKSSENSETQYEYTRREYISCPRIAYANVNERMPEDFTNTYDTTEYYRNATMDDWYGRIFYTAESISIARFKCSKLFNEESDDELFQDRIKIKDYIQEIIKNDHGERKRLALENMKIMEVSKEDNESKCPICMESILSDCKKLSCCKALIHRKCLNKYKKFNTTQFKCPLCSKTLTNEELNDLKFCLIRKSGRKRKSHEIDTGKIRKSKKKSKRKSKRKSRRK